MTHLSSCLVFIGIQNFRGFFLQLLIYIQQIHMYICVCVCARLHLRLSVSQVNCEYHFIRPVGFCVTLVLPLKIIFSIFSPFFLIIAYPLQLQNARNIIIAVLLLCASVCVCACVCRKVKKILTAFTIAKTNYDLCFRNNVTGFLHKNLEKTITSALFIAYELYNNSL